MVDRPTMQTVAVAAGVSRMTVSNAYNRPDQLTADTRERVLQVARQLGYRARIRLPSRCAAGARA